MDTAFFVLSKLVVVFLQVETWFAVGLTASLLAGLANRRRLSIISGAVTLAGFLAIGILPLGILLIHPLEAEFPPAEAPDHIDGIIVLGGVEDTAASLAWGRPQINGAAERLTESAALALQFPEAQVVFSGGSGRLKDALNIDPNLPSVAQDFLSSFGISGERVIWEDQSRNTAENARYSYSLVNPRPEDQWVLVTSSFHMGRAIRSFHTANWQNVTPFPVDYRSGHFRDGIGWDPIGNIDLLNIAFKERIGRVTYALSNR